MEPLKISLPELNNDNVDHCRRHGGLARLRVSPVGSSQISPLSTGSDGDPSSSGSSGHWSAGPSPEPELGAIYTLLKQCSRAEAAFFQNVLKQYFDEGRVGSSIGSASSASASTSAPSSPADPSTSHSAALAARSIHADSLDKKPSGLRDVLALAHLSHFADDSVAGRLSDQSPSISPDALQSSVDSSVSATFSALSDLEQDTWDSSLPSSDISLRANCSAYLDSLIDVDINEKRLMEFRACLSAWKPEIVDLKEKYMASIRRFVDGIIVKLLPLSATTYDNDHSLPKKRQYMASTVKAVVLVLDILTHAKRLPVLSDELHTLEQLESRITNQWGTLSDKFGGTAKGSQSDVTSDVSVPVPPITVPMPMLAPAKAAALVPSAKLKWLQDMPSANRRSLSPLNLPLSDMSAASSSEPHSRRHNSHADIDSNLLRNSNLNASIDSLRSSNARAGDILNGSTSSLVTAVSAGPSDSLHRASLSQARCWSSLISLPAATSDGNSTAGEANYGVAGHVAGAPKTNTVASSTSALHCLPHSTPATYQPTTPLLSTNSLGVASFQWPPPPMPAPSSLQQLQQQLPSGNYSSASHGVPARSNAHQALAPTRSAPSGSIPPMLSPQQWLMFLAAQQQQPNSQLSLALLQQQLATLPQSQSGVGSNGLLSGAGILAASCASASDVALTPASASSIPALLSAPSASMSSASPMTVIKAQSHPPPLQLQPSTTLSGANGCGSPRFTTSTASPTSPRADISNKTLPTIIADAAVGLTGTGAALRLALGDMGKERNTFLEEGSGMRDVPIWLKTLRLHKYSHLFQQMTYDDMMNLTEEWMDSHGVTKGARHKILLHVEKLKARPQRLYEMEKSLTEDPSTIRNMLHELRLLLNTPIRPFRPVVGAQQQQTMTTTTSTASSAGSFGSCASRVDGALPAADLSSGGACNASTASPSPSPSPSSTPDGGLCPDDLSARITRLMGKICAHLLVMTQPDVDCLNMYIPLVDKCTHHEAFTEKQRNLLISWKQQIQRSFHLPLMCGNNFSGRNSMSGGGRYVANCANGASSNETGAESGVSAVGGSILDRRMRWHNRTYPMSSDLSLGYKRGNSSQLRAQWFQAIQNCARHNSAAAYSPLVASPSNLIPAGGPLMSPGAGARGLGLGGLSGLSGLSGLGVGHGPTSLSGPAPNAGHSVSMQLSPLCLTSSALTPSTPPILSASAVSASAGAFVGRSQFFFPEVSGTSSRLAYTQMSQMSQSQQPTARSNLQRTGSVPLHSSGPLSASALGTATQGTCLPVTPAPSGSSIGMNGFDGRGVALSSQSLANSILAMAPLIPLATMASSTSVSTAALPSRSLGIDCPVTTVSTGTVVPNCTLDCQISVQDSRDCRGYSPQIPSNLICSADRDRELTASLDHLCQKMAESFLDGPDLSPL